MEGSGNMFGLFALSSAIGSHLLSKYHFSVENSWYENKWFWAGFFGNLPALCAFIAPIAFSGDQKKKGAK